MMHMDVKLTEELVKVTDALRKKYKAITNGSMGHESELEETFKPVMHPLKKTTKVAAHLRIKCSLRELIKSINLESFSELLAKYLNLYVNNSSNIDPFNGVRYKNNNIMLGDKILHFHGDDQRVKEKTFKGTPGLYELLFMRRPKKISYTQDDLHNYKALLNETNAHRRDYSESGQILGSRGWKYTNILSKLIDHIGIRKVDKLFKHIGSWIVDNFG